MSQISSPASTTVETRHNRWIVILSIAIPIVVAVLFGVKIPDVGPFRWLPPTYATINGVTAILLVGAVAAIKQRRRLLHERLIKTSMALSATFLVLYVVYHMTSDSTPYGGQGPWRYVYYTILISHILLSIGVIPVVLLTYSKGAAGNLQRHRQLAKYAFPLWLYVTVSGVVVYLMISPYYGP